MSFEFSKYSGCGNDFILIDNRNGIFDPHPNLIQTLCARRTGIGADGIILLENSLHSDFRMRIYNSDGYEAEMCGNGIRCLMKFIQECGIHKNNCTIETFLRPLEVSLEKDLVSVQMGAPFDYRWNVHLAIDGNSYLVHHINTGVPHIVLFTDDFENFNLPQLGPKFRFHESFAPQGANMNIAQLSKEGFLLNRTFERGVEQETLACGTGCVAAALAANRILGLPSPIRVKTRSEEILEISFKMDNESQLSNLVMKGPANRIFSGKWRG